MSELGFGCSNSGLEVNNMRRGCRQWVLGHKDLGNCVGG